MTRLLVAALLLAWVAPSQAAGPPLRTDLYGDPLPPGAIARCGSVRLRHAGLSNFVCLADGKTVLTAGTDGVLRYWDLASGRQARERALQATDAVTRWVMLAPDGKAVAGPCDNEVVI